MKSPAYDMTSIPASLASGEYLMRHDSELLALHQANTPQFYPECAGLIRSGGGSANPGARFKTKFPGGCSMSDPGVKVGTYIRRRSSFHHRLPISRTRGLEWADLVEKR